MDEVRLKVENTSRFIDNLIKVVTFVSFLLFFASFYVYRYKAGEIYKNQVSLCDAVWSQGMTEGNPLEGNPIQKAFLGVKNDCFDNAGRTADLWGRVAFIALDITVLLPLVYFGGKKIVKDSAEKINKLHSLK